MSHHTTTVYLMQQLIPAEAHMFAMCCRSGVCPAVRNQFKLSFEVDLGGWVLT